MMGMTLTLHDTTDWHNLTRNRERERGRLTASPFLRALLLFFYMIFV